MTSLRESNVEHFVITLLQQQGYIHLSPEQHGAERADLYEVVLRQRLHDAIEKLNPAVPQQAKAQAIKEVVELPHHSLTENNRAVHYMLTDGVAVEYQKDGETVGDSVRLVDFETPHNNDLLVCSQYTVRYGERTNRADVVLFVNGLPMVVIELKNPTDRQATVHKAFTQLQNYKTSIAPLFWYNGVLVASNGLDAKMGSLTAQWTRFMAWKTVDGKTEDSRMVPQIETLIKGMLRPTVLLNLIRHCTVFERVTTEDARTKVKSVDTVKKIAAYHQYHAVQRAVQATIDASKADGNRKVGVVWHTQGSGKSLSMVFYAGRIVLELGNPTIVVITDRNDLDNQLFDTFADNTQLLRQEPVQADNRAHLQQLLKTAGGGIVFTTIQKFFPQHDREHYELLSERTNIVVIADEAHRSHYGFGAKTVMKDGKATTKYGHAKYLRDALPNASFIGFTGTPIEKTDASTPAVFGNYIDVYDIEQAVADGATVKIYYESRLAKVHLNEHAAETLDDEIDTITEQAELSVTEQAKSKWARVEAVVGNSKRLQDVAADIIDHFAKRQQVMEGKAMIVAMSRRIAVELYRIITELCPDWHNEDIDKGAIKVVMTSAASDPADWQLHHTTKPQRKTLSDRFKDPSDPLQLVIVRDMWLTGFDAPCLHTMYVDKLIRGHNLMQAIARVNRVYKDKAGGLIVDYIGIATELKTALATYTESDGTGTPVFNQQDAVNEMLKQYEIVAQLFNGFDYQRYTTVDAREKMTIILAAEEHILGIEDGKNRYAKQVALLSKAFALAVPSPAALDRKEMVGFFQAVQARLSTETTLSRATNPEIETAIRQIVDNALVAEGVVDIFSAAGIKKPDIAVFSDEFLQEVQGMEHKNLAVELLRKILNDEITMRTRHNYIQNKKFSEMLYAAIKKYQNNVLTAAQVIEELIDLAKEIQESARRGDELGLNDNEVAFYDALAMNDSAKEVLGDSELQQLAKILVQKVRTSATIDWTIREGVRAKLRAIVKRLLRKYGYPPDQQLLATENIIKQAELFADEWS